MPKQEMTFEQAAAKIDEIVSMLERGDAPLDKSLALFEEGTGLIKKCSKMLDEAEQKVTMLQSGNDNKSSGDKISDEEDDDEEIPLIGEE